MAQILAHHLIELLPFAVSRKCKLDEIDSDLVDI